MFGKLDFNKKLIFAFGLLFSASALYAQAESGSKAKNQIGIVISPEAAVYQGPDFDSAVIDSLEENQKVPMSNKKFKSSSDFGSFFKVKTPKGKIGYVGDNDIQPLRLKKKMDEEMGQHDGESIYYKKMLGVSLATVNYAEKFQDKYSKAQTTMLGFRMTGPDVLGDSPPLDVNVWLGFKPPSYYDSISGGKASGFFLLGDVGVVFPVVDWTKSLLNFGLGVMWTYTHFKVPIGGKDYASDELRIGIDLSFGGAIKFGKEWVGRGDIKYFVDKTPYTGLMLSLQRIY